MIEGGVPYGTKRRKYLQKESRYELMKTRIKLLLYAEIELLDKGEVLAEKEAKAQETK